MARNYLRSSFAIDMLGSFPINIVLDAVLASSGEQVASGQAWLSGEENAPCSSSAHLLPEPRHMPALHDRIACRTCRAA